jgi:hypothetical protein
MIGSIKLKAKSSFGQSPSCSDTFTNFYFDIYVVRILGWSYTFSNEVLVWHVWKASWDLMLQSLHTHLSYLGKKKIPIFMQFDKLKFLLSLRDMWFKLAKKEKKEICSFILVFYTFANLSGRFLIPRRLN